MRRFVVASLLLALLPSLAIADDWRTTEKEFKKRWSSTDPVTKISALNLLVKADRETAAKHLVMLLGEKPARTVAKLQQKKKALQAKRMELLKTGREIKTINGLRRYVWKPGMQAEYMKCYQELRKITAQIGRTGDLRGEIVGAISQLKAKDSLSYLYTRALAERGWEKPTGVLEALGLGGLEESKPHVRKKIKATEFRVATAAIDASAKLGDKEAFLDIVRQLDNKQWQVRAAAIAALAKIGGKRAIAPLVVRLQEEDGRLEEDISEALNSITGLSLGGSKEGWKRWLALNKDRLDEVIAAAKKAAKVKKDKEGEGRTSSFYGITTNSKRICFIIDISGSMRAKARLSPTEISGQGKGYPVDGTKLDVCKFELTRAIKGLPKDASFNVIYYHTTVAVYKKTRLVEATEGNKKKAIAWVKTLQPTGGTNIFEALMKAFTLASPDPDSTKNYKYGADTVFFMTDGAPSAGPVTDTGQIVAQITAKNKRFKLKIHCIAVGTARTDFLKELAEKNGGSFIHHGAPPQKGPPIKKLQPPPRRNP